MVKRLGKGLEEIIETGGRGASSVVMIRTDQMRPNRFQPRAAFEQQDLKELQASIQRQGLLQPVIVRPIAQGTYELVAGERRWRAAQALGMQEVPSLVKTLNDREAIEYSLIENVQRQDLNPLEEAVAYRRLSEEFGYTQEEVAQAIGKDRATIANALRLLKLPHDVQQALRDGMITMGHARALVAVEGVARQLELLARTTRGKLSVRQLEVLARTGQPARRRRVRWQDPQGKLLEDRLRQALGTKVSLVSRQKGGRIVIEYFSPEDLARILQTLGVDSSS